MKRELEGTRYDEEKLVSDAAEVRPHKFLFELTLKVKARWDKCVALGGDFMEKLKSVPVCKTWCFHLPFFIMWEMTYVMIILFKDGDYCDD